MNKNDFLKCLPDEEDLRGLMFDCYCEDHHFTDFDDFQTAIADFVKGQIENLEYKKKRLKKKQANKYKWRLSKISGVWKMTRLNPEFNWIEIRSLTFWEKLFHVKFKENSDNWNGFRKE